MKKVVIKFDPYNMRSSVIVDGKEIQNYKHCDNNLKTYLNANVPMPIQTWIDPISRDNWKGLLHALCQMGDKDIVIKFSGRMIDYFDIQNSLNAQNETMKCNANLTFCDLSDEIVPDSQMRENIAEVIDLMLKDKFASIVRGSGSEELIEKYNNLKKTYEEIDAEEFRIVFTGTYSSGKSSTINALIGKNLLPTAKGTCTTKVCRIIHDSSKDYFAKLKYSCNGKEKQFECKTDTEIQDRIRAVDDVVEKIEVYTDLSKLYPESTDISFKIVIIDTPGTDSATGNDTEKTEEERKRLSKKSHIEITKEILESKQKEMIILVSDDKFEDDNIVELLDLIEDSAIEDDGAFNDRFLFAMNMCDSLAYSNEGENLENSIRDYISNIKKVPNSSRIRNIVNPRIFPITSGSALAVVNGYVTRPEREEKKTKKAELYSYYEAFCKKVYYEEPKTLEELDADFKEDEYADFNYCLEQQSATSESVKHEYRRKLDGIIDVSERIMIHSGIPALKNAIQEYIMHYAYPIKVRQLLECFTDILSEINGLNEKEIEELEEAKKAYSDAVSSKEEIENERRNEQKRQETLESINKKMEKVSNNVDTIKETIPQINKIRSSFYVIKNSVAERIGDKAEVEKTEGDAIIIEISQKIDTLIATIKDIVYKVKNEKKETADVLYNEFMEYIDELEKSGLMSDGKFDLKDTVAYRKLIDKEGFKKPKETIIYVDNPKKEHIEFGYGIGNFFSSIAKSWKTRNEPNTIGKYYINIKKYVTDNINPIEAEIDKYVEQIKTDYQKDIQALKENTKNRMFMTSALIKQNSDKIQKIRVAAYKIASDKEKYIEKIGKLEKNKEYLEKLIDKISYTQI